MLSFWNCLSGEILPSRSASMSYISLTSFLSGLQLTLQGPNELICLFRQGGLNNITYLFQVVCG